MRFAPTLRLEQIGLSDDFHVAATVSKNPRGGVSVYDVSVYFRTAQVTSQMSADEMLAIENMVGDAYLKETWESAV